jgi:site-specific DNA-methyltransferase (adenine-specific)
VTAPYYEDDLVTLYHGDYREHLDSLAGFAIVTDPPYGETSLEWDRWPEAWPTDLIVAAPSLWCFGSFRMFMDRRDDFAAWKFSHEIVWEKHNGSGFAADKFRRVHELATLWYQGNWADVYHEVPKVAGATKRTVRRKERPAHMGAIANSTYTSQDGGDLLMRSVLRVRSTHGHAVHPTQKPLGIVSPLIEYSVPAGCKVVDPFAGSGTTLLAASLTGRRAVGVEVNEAYCEAAARRLSQQSFDLEGIA